MDEVMKIEAEQDLRARSGVETISESELKKICDRIYLDRFQIYDFNPSAAKHEALLWMLLGCLISLLNIKDAELASADSSGQNLYVELICKLLTGRTAPPFDPRPIVEGLAGRAEQ